MTYKLEPKILRFEQVSFVIDVDRQVLRQTDKPEHEISFIHHMTDKGDHYELNWDRENNTVSDDAEKADKIIIDQLVWLDPERMSLKYGIPIPQLQQMSDFEVIVDQSALEKRHQGVLPQINLAGETFVVDVALQELRHASNFHPVISIKSFELTSDGQLYEAYYDTALKQVVDLDFKMLEFPESVVKIRMPNEIGLDPVAAARQYGLAERDLLRQHPLKMQLNAQVVPLSETHIPALIRQNKDALIREHAQNARNIKPKHRPKI